MVIAYGMQELLRINTTIPDVKKKKIGMQTAIFGRHWWFEFFKAIVLPKNSIVRVDVESVRLRDTALEASFSIINVYTCVPSVYKNNVYMCVYFRFSFARSSSN